MELYQQEFRDLIRNHFEHVKLLVQRTVFGSVITPETGITSFEFVTGDYRGFERQRGLADPMYSICIASSAPLPEAKTTIFGSKIEYSYAMQDKMEIISTLEQRLRNQSATIESIERSLSFRLGRMMTAPARWLLGK
jgi:hypothetical protein